MPEKFEESVTELRKRFTDRTRPDYVFQPSYHKRIPADGVSFYMEGIWVCPNQTKADVRNKSSQTKTSTCRHSKNCSPNLDATRSPRSLWRYSSQAPKRFVVRSMGEAW